MKRFRLLKETRQSTEYSCGASTLQAVLSYWGRDLGEEDLMKLLHTTPETGTYPEDIVRVARSLGFEVEVKENLTLDEVEKSTTLGNPVIVLGQALAEPKGIGRIRGRRLGKRSLCRGSCNRRRLCLFRGPLCADGQGFMPRGTFEEHWHNVMGGDLEKNPKQICLGIFIRGEKPAEPQRFKDVDFTTLDFGKIGSLNLMVTQFPGILLRTIL